MTNDLPTEISEKRSFLTRKRKRLLAFVVWTFLSGFESVFLRSYIPPAIAFLVTSIGYGILLLGWCMADSEEREEELGGGWKFMLVFLGLFAFIAYLFKTRGFSRGLLSILYSIGFAIGVFVVDLVVLTIILLVAQMGFGFATPK